jgi:hypothetical protein
MESNIKFYRNFSEETFSDESCFLCGKYCDSKTAEHIFPKWLQHKFKLWDKKLIISNGTNVPYRNLTVPCCSKCNNVHLSQMEEKFKLLLDKSFQELTFEDEKTIFQWTAKILYATRYKELSLLVDRANPNLGKIISPEELESYSSLHLFLQSIRFKTQFNEPRPWSIFIFPCKDEEFWYHNNTQALCLSMKFGEIAITIVYEENNLISDFMAPLKDLYKIKLSFPQYLEATAHIFYSGMLKEKVPHYLSSFNQNTELLIVDTVGSLNSRKWIDKEFASVLDFMLFSCGIDIGSSVLQPEGLVTSFLIDENNEHLLKKHFRKKASS